MFYSLTFEKKVNGNSVSKNTWNDWHLIPSSRPDISIPSRNLNFVDIPGRDGSLDISEYLAGRPTLSDRTGSWEFIVVSEYDGKDVDLRSWLVRKNELITFLDGSVMKVRMEELPGYYYEGRVYTEPNSWKTGSNFSTITFAYRLKPYKYNASTGKEAGI